MFTDDWHQGDTICTSCGICMPERLIDCEHEAKRNFSSDSSASGMKEDKSSTMRTDKFMGFQGTRIKMPTKPNTSEENISIVSSLSAQQNRTMDNKSRRLQAGLMEITDLCAALRLSDAIKNIASEKWANFEKARKKHSRGGDKFMYAALIYSASKEAGTSRTFDEISNYTGLDKKEIVKCYKRLVKEEQRDAPIDSPKNATTPAKKSAGTSLESTKSRIDRISQTLQLDYPVTVKAKGLVETYAKVLEGKKPDTIAAVCITKALPKELPVKSIADAAKISSNTLRSALDQIATAGL